MDQAASQTAGLGTVLVVDDESSIRITLREVLESYGYRVLEAATGDEAISHCERATGELLLLLTDVAMPQMNGADLVRRVKARRPGLPILYMSGQVDLSCLEDSLLQGAGFIQKPFTIGGLFSKIREVMEHRAY